MKKVLLLLCVLPLIGFGQCVSGDCEDGFGTYINKEGDKYEQYKYVGEWKNGQKHGQGVMIMTWNSNDRYVGEWKNDKKDGYGTDKWVEVETGEIGGEYIGEFKDGEIFGEGTWIFIEIEGIESKGNVSSIKRGVWKNWNTLVE